MHDTKHSHVSIVCHFVMGVMCTCDMAVFVGFQFHSTNSNEHQQSLWEWTVKSCAWHELVSMKFYFGKT